MSSRSKKPCRKMGCPNLAEYPNKYCKDHSAEEERDRADRNRFYDRYTRNDEDSKQFTDFYNSTRWKKARYMRLQIDNGLCQVCKGRGLITIADTVHHIVEVKEDWEKRLEMENLVSLCKACHNEIHKNK